MKKQFWNLLRNGLVLMLVWPVYSLAGADLNAEQKGYELAARSDRSDRGFGDSEVELKMILRNKTG